MKGDCPLGGDGSCCSGGVDWTVDARGGGVGEAIGGIDEAFEIAGEGSLGSSGI